MIGRFFQSLWPSQVILTLFWNLYEKMKKLWNFWFFQLKYDNSWLYQVTLPWLQKKKFQSHLKRDETKVSGLAEHLLFFAPFQIFPLLPQFSVYFSCKNPGLGIQRWLHRRIKSCKPTFASSFFPLIFLWNTSDGMQKAGLNWILHAIWHLNSLFKL